MLIVKKKNFKNLVNKPLLLIDKNKAYGLIKLNPPIEIGEKEFKQLRPLHLISDEEKKKWGFKGRLYAYTFEIITKFKKPIPIKIPKGAQTFVDIKNIKFNN